MATKRQTYLRVAATDFYLEQFNFFSLISSSMTTKIHFLRTIISLFKFRLVILGEKSWSFDNFLSPGPLRRFPIERSLALDHESSTVFTIPWRCSTYGKTLLRNFSKLIRHTTPVCEGTGSIPARVKKLIFHIFDGCHD